MEERFDTVLLEEAKEFIGSLDKKSRKKILFNIWKAKLQNDSSLFKPLENNIWEFRALYLKQQIRLFAFWDKTESKRTLVIATHGILKKTSKVPKKEIEKATMIRNKYFEDKNS